MTSIRAFIQHLSVSVAFLSRLPVPERLTGTDFSTFKRATWCFPLAGIIVCIPAILAAYLISFTTPTALIVVITFLIIQTIVTGALHEDGMADTIDGFGGGKNTQAKLDIMKDSAIGTYGVVALILTYLLKISILFTIADYQLYKMFFAIISAHTFARGLQILFWHSLPVARYRGLSHQIGRPDKATAWIALAFGTILAFFIIAFVFSAFQIVSAFLLASLAFVGFRYLCLRQIRGQTGDTIGAMFILAEIAFLFGLATSFS